MFIKNRLIGCLQKKQAAEKKIMFSFSIGCDDFAFFFLKKMSGDLKSALFYFQEAEKAACL